MRKGSNWSREADRDVLKGTDRIGQVLGVVFTMIVASFLGLHWTGETGFYTPEFTELEAMILFVPILFGILPNLMRTVLGRRNAVRPLDSLGIVLFVFSAIYFLSNFHFDMAYFADPLPEPLRFLIDWIDEGWARILLMIGIFGGAIGLFWTLVTYVKVRELLVRRE